MGAYLACGVAINILVKRSKKGEKVDINDLERIKTHFNNFFSLDNYELYISEDYFSFTIKKNYFEKNIHAVIKELAKLFYLDISYIFCKDNANFDFNSDEFCQDNYPIELKEADSYGFVDLVAFGKYDSFNDLPPYDSPYWLYRNTNLFDDFRGYKISISTSAIWVDCFKYVGESAVNMLYALNIMKKSYFKSPMSENLVFYIFG